MTAMDILEALGQTQEELLSSCDHVIGGAENREADMSASMNEENREADESAIGDGEKADAQDLPDQKKRKSQKMLIPWRKAKYRRAAVGLMAAAAVLLLVYVGRGAFISRSFDSMSSGSSNSTSTAESAEISADTAEEESAVEESETVEMEEELTKESAMEENSTATTSSEESSSIAPDESVSEAEGAGMQDDAQTESAALDILQLGEVYIPGFATSSLSDSEYVEWMELAAQVQEEIDTALSQEMYDTLPVYRFVRMEEFASDQHERLGDYPVITAEEAEELLWQGYYLSVTGFSEEAADSVEVASVELQYLICAETQIYMPYYQFNVVADGDMVYICCVPAVSSEYLEGTLQGGSVE